MRLLLTIPLGLAVEIRAAPGGTPPGFVLTNDDAPGPLPTPNPQCPAPTPDEPQVVTDGIPESVVVQLATPWVTRLGGAVEHPDAVLGKVAIEANAAGFPVTGFPKLPSKGRLPTAEEISVICAAAWKSYTGALPTVDEAPTADECAAIVSGISAWFASRPNGSGQ